MALLPSLIVLFALQAPQPDALYRAGTASLQARHYPEAEASFREAYRLEPDNLRGLMGLTQVYLAQSMSAQALDLLRTESAKHPERADIHILLGDVAARTGKPDMALAEYDAALKLLDVVSTQRAGVYLRMGEVYRDKGDKAASLDAMQKAAELAPADPAVLVNLATVLDASGDKKGAIAQYRAALAANPNIPAAQNNLAYLIADTGGDLYEALRLARRASQSAPGNPDIEDTVGWVSLKLGWIDEAVDTFSRAVLAQPANKSFRMHLAEALDRSTDTSASVTELKAALRAESGEENQRKVQDLLKAQRPK